MKIVKCLEVSSSLVESINETMKMKQKNKNLDFLAFVTHI